MLITCVHSDVASTPSQLIESRHSDGIKCSILNEVSVSGSQYNILNYSCWTIESTILLFYSVVNPDCLHRFICWGRERVGDLHGREERIIILS